MGGLTRAVHWWEESQMRVLVLGSLVVQFLLLILTLFRNRAIPGLIRSLMWLAYLGGDAISIYALATLFNRHKKDQGGDGGSSRSLLEVVWAPILLIHLGGHDGITAYNIEDNELWTRHLLTAVSQVTVAIYVFSKSWQGGDKRLLQAAIILFVPGVIKSFAKPWALKRASIKSLVSSPSSQSTREKTKEDMKRLEKYMQGRAKASVQGQKDEGKQNEGEMDAFEPYLKGAMAFVREQQKDGEQKDEAESQVNPTAHVEDRNVLPSQQGDDTSSSKDRRQGRKNEWDLNMILHGEAYNLFVDLFSPFPLRLSIFKCFWALSEERVEKAYGSVRQGLASAFILLYTKMKVSFFRTMIKSNPLRDGMNIWRGLMKRNNFLRDGMKFWMGFFQNLNNFLRDRMNFWRGFFQKMNLNNFLRDGMNIWRGFFQKINFWRELPQKMNFWRGFAQKMNFWRELPQKMNFWRDEANSSIKDSLIMYAAYSRVYLPWAAIGLFHHSHTKAYSPIDVKITYALFCCTAAIELVSSCSGDIMVVFSMEQWPETVAQYNLTEYFARNKNHSITMWILSLFGCKDLLDQYCCMRSCSSSGAITELVLKYLKDGWKKKIRDPVSYRKFNDHRGQWALESYEDKLGWSIKGPFDESVLLWHIATDICLFSAPPDNIEAVQWRAPPDNIEAVQSRQMSNYMMYLLFVNPEMLLPGTRRSLFTTAYDELKDIIGDKNLNPQSCCCCCCCQQVADNGVLKTLINNTKPERDRSNKENFINKAWDLAQGLLKLRVDLGEKKMWEVIQGVWVEMLCFSASRCRGYLHAKALGSGGEFLSYVWLLMFYMGMETFSERLQREELPSWEANNNGTPLTSDAHSGSVTTSSPSQIRNRGASSPSNIHTGMSTSSSEIHVVNID